MFLALGEFSSKDTLYLNEYKNKVQSILKSPKFAIHITLLGPYYEVDDIFLSKLKIFAQSNSSLYLYLKILLSKIKFLNHSIFQLINRES